MVEGFTGKQACGIVGITYRQLDYWARTSLLVPSVEQAHGTGTRRLYSFQDLINLKVLKQMLDGGISLQNARRAVDCLAKVAIGDLIRCNVVVTGTGAVLAFRDDEIIDLVRGGQGVLNILPLEQLIHGVQADIKLFKSKTYGSKLPLFDDELVEFTQA